MLVALASCRTPPTPEGDSPRGDLAAYARARHADEVVADLALRPGMVVADVGCGRGAFIGPLARAVGPAGRVVATDIDGRALDAVRALARSAVSTSEAPVETRLVPAASPGLEAGRYDLIWLSDVDQYLPDRAAYFGALRAALAPHGRLAVTNRMIYRQAVMDAAASAHLVVTRQRSAALAHFVVELEANNR